MRYGIIGTGMMGLEHLRNIALLPDAEVAALADPDPAMLRKAGDLARALGHSPHLFTHHDDLLARERALDALLVVAPNHLHHPIMRDAMETGLPILCEKPLATTLEDAWDLVALGDGRAAPVWVAMEYRYMPPVATLLDTVRDGTLGRVMMFSIREHRFPFLPKVGGWNRRNEATGGTMVEKCCHFFDLMRLALGSEPTRVFASGGQGMNVEEAADMGPTDVVDHAYTVVEFEGGGRAALDLCMFAEGSFWQEEVTAIGSRAKIEARVPGPARFWPGGEEREGELVLSPRHDKAPVKVDVPVDPTVLRAGDHHGATFYQHRAFARMVREGGAPAVSLRDGAMAVEMGLAAETSIRTGEPVEFTWRGGVAGDETLARVG